MQVIERPFLVVRAAGSGMEGTGDLLVLRGDICFPIEVKSTKQRKLYLSGRTLDQYEAMVDTGQKCGLMPIYAHRLKGVRGDSWRLFRVDVGPLEGRLAIIARRMPALPLTGRGRPHLDWQQGMPLHRFLGLVCRREVESDEVDAKQRSNRIDMMLARLSERAEDTTAETRTAVEMNLSTKRTRLDEPDPIEDDTPLLVSQACEREKMPLGQDESNVLFKKKQKPRPSWADKFQL
jgi:Holliday junction resolvase